MQQSLVGLLHYLEDAQAEVIVALHDPNSLSSDSGESGDSGSLSWRSGHSGSSPNISTRTVPHISRRNSPSGDGSPERLHESLPKTTERHSRVSDNAIVLSSGHPSQERVTGTQEAILSELRATRKALEDANSKTG